MKTKKGKQTNKYSIIAIAILLIVLIGGGIYYFFPKKHYGLKVGYLPITACLPYFIGSQQGYFAKQNLDVTPVRYETSQQMMDAFIQGQVDVITSVSTTVALQVEEKSPSQYKVFGVNTSQVSSPLNVLIVKKDSPIQSVADLKGKKIGSFPGVQAVGLLKKYLREHGIDPTKDVQIQEIKQDLHLQALDSGQVDAVLTYEPNATIGRLKGISRNLIDDVIAQASVNPYPTGVFAVSKRYMDQNPGSINQLTKAFNQSMQYANNNPSEARAALPTFFSIDKSVAEQVPLSHFDTLETIDKTNLQKFADVLYGEKIINQKADVTAILLEK